MRGWGPVATLDDVQGLFRNFAGITVADKVDGTFPVTFRGMPTALTETEVDSYLQSREGLVAESDTSVYLPGYYEHAVDLQGAGRLQLMRRDEEGVVLTSHDQQATFELSSISTRFLLAIFDSSERRQMSQILRRVHPRGLGRSPRSADVPQFRNGFGVLLTAKVTASEEFRTRASKNALRSIAEAGLFNVSYARGVALSLSRSWERSYFRLGIRRNSDIQFPRRTYNSDLLAYYHLALSSDSLILAYLSLYKILEYFYISTAEAVLHDRLKDKLAAPNFTHRHTAQLRELISIVRRFDQRTDEKKMLANVIARYFMPDEIADWVREHESATDQHYTASYTVLGLPHKLDLNPDRVSSSLAKRIYHVRNALVHNKEGELPRFIPFTGQEDTLVKELPILMFLTEQLIIKTGNDV